MKFLDWMHRKLMHSGTGPDKNSTIAHTLFDEKNWYKEPTKTVTCLNIRCQKSSDRFEVNEKEMIFQEEAFEPFDFLAIGTFGMELLHTDPPTPTLAKPHENLIYPHTEITENDLKFINYELEKFLESEKKEIAYDTSARSSQASIITLGLATTEGADSEGQMHTMACPLQNYLFATTIETNEEDEGLNKEKTALRGHFKENNMAHNKNTTKRHKGSEQKPRNLSHCMKKMVNKFNSSARCTKDSSKNDEAVSISIKKRLSKTIKIFGRKVVNPEEKTEKQFAKLQKQGKKDISHKMIDERGEKWSEEGTTNKPCSTSDGGHWIKTDSEYLVLEL